MAYTTYTYQKNFSAKRLLILHPLLFICLSSALTINIYSNFYNSSYVIKYNTRDLFITFLYFSYIHTINRLIDVQSLFSSSDYIYSGIFSLLICDLRFPFISSIFRMIFHLIPLLIIKYELYTFNINR